MNLKRLYFFYSTFFFIILIPVFIFFYTIKIFTEYKLKDKKYIMKYVCGLKSSKGGNGRDIGATCKKVYGGFNNCLLKIIIGDIPDRRIIFLKKYSCFGSFFTFWGNWFAPYGNSRKISASSRVANEVYYNRLLGQNGIKTPKILEIDSMDNVLIMDFIEGEKLDEIELKDELLYNIGGLVAKIHSLGIYMNDNTPCNFILSGCDIYIVDLEGFTSRGSRDWDLATFIFWLESNHADINKFMEGYAGASENKAASSEENRKQNIEDMRLIISSYRPISFFGSYLRDRI